MKKPSPCRERPSGLLELFEAPSAIADRKFCCISGVCALHRTFGDENRLPVVHKLRKSRKTMGDKQVLGERDANSDERSEVEVFTPKATKAAGIFEEQVQALLDRKEVLQSEADDLRPKSVNTEASPEETSGFPPYDPESNPLSPRPTFLRYNPHKRLDFLRSDAELPRLRRSEESLTTPKEELTRSDSCPAALLDDGRETVEDEVKQWEEALEVLEVETGSPDAGGSSKWWRLLKRAALMVTLLFCLLAALLVLDNTDAVNELRGTPSLPSWEQTTLADGENQLDVFLPNRTFVHAPLNVVSVETQSLSAEDTMLLAAEEDPQTLSSLEDEVLGSCSGSDWDERILGMCLDRSFKVTSTAATGQNDGSSRDLEVALNIDIPVPVTEMQLEEPVTFEEPAEVTFEEPTFEQPACEEPASEGTAYGNASLERDQELVAEPLSSGVFQLLEPEPVSTGEISPTGILDTFFYNVTSRFSKAVIALAGLLLASLTSLTVLRKSRRAGMPTPRQETLIEVVDPSTALSTPEVAANPPTMVTPGLSTPVRIEIADHQPVMAIRSLSSPLRSAPSTTSDSTGESFSNDSQDSAYGSFTAIEPVVLTRQGHVKLTPVRRSSRIRSRNQPPRA